MKLYVSKTYLIKDKDLKESLLELKRLQDISDKDKNVEPLYRGATKTLYNHIRRGIRSKNLIGTAIHKTEDKVLVFEFDKKAEDNGNGIYELHHDEDGKLYVEVEEDIK
jgi:hypothetical protein